MKNLFLFFIVFPFLGNAQILDLNQGTTYAVVVGISDYQDDGIPDLRFADRDAEAFANFLRSPGGGGLDEDHLKILINEQATQAQFAGALDWLWEVATENDRAIIYFSGHGDVEKKSITNPGYLLCWDSGSRLYMAGGAFNVRDLNDVIATISTQNKAKVLLITDACRAGKLSGSGIGGSQATAAHLAKTYANEVKILSCQPDEFSIEGEQWGGGRGAFSYHLLEGLYGLADSDYDLNVSLKEIGRYLEDRVSEEVAPHGQNPMTVGNKTEKLTQVSPSILEQLKIGKQGLIVQFDATDSKGMEDNLLAALDSNIVEMYFAFKQSLEDKTFLTPEKACADWYYEQLINEPVLEKLHSSMRRNYAAALQDDAQQVLNGWLRIANSFKSKSTLTREFGNYPRYLERAAELLGKTHYMYPVLQSRKLYFEGYLMHIDTRQADEELGNKIMAKYRKALEWQPNSPHVYTAMMSVNFYQLLEADSAEHYAHRANELVPGWALPYTQLAYIYSAWTVLRDTDKTEHFLDLAEETDATIATSHGFHMLTRADNYRNTGRLQEAEQGYKKMISLGHFPYGAYFELGSLYASTGEYEKAEAAYNKAYELDSTNWVTPIVLGMVYIDMKAYVKAEIMFNKAHQLDSVNLWAPMQLACLYIRTKRFEEGEEKFRQVIEKDSTFAIGYNNVGDAYLSVKRYKKAEWNYKKAIQLDPKTAIFKSKLGYTYMVTLRFAEAEEQFLKVISLDSIHPTAYANLGLVYTRTGRYTEAEQNLDKSLEVSPANAKNISAYYAILYSLQGKTDKAFASLEQAFQQGFKKDDSHINIIEEDTLAPLRAQTERWEALMKKYFP